MVQHAAAGGHAAGGNDDGRSFHIVDFFGVLDAAHVMHVVSVKRVPILFQVGIAQNVVFVVTHIHFGDADGHGTVHKNGKARNAIGVLQLANDIHDGLRAIHGERWNHDHAAALDDAIDDL